MKNEPLHYKFANTKHELRSAFADSHVVGYDRIFAQWLQQQDIKINEFNNSS